MKRLLAIIIPIAMALPCHAFPAELKDILHKLDECLKNGTAYVQEKEEKIAGIHSMMQEADGIHEAQLYDITYSLFEEYKSFKYDSAYFYANESLKLAYNLHDTDRIVMSHCALAFCHISSGLFMEAFNEMQKIDVRKASPKVKAEYYSLYNRLYYDASDFNDTEEWSHEYTRRGTEYADSLMAIVPEDSYQWVFAKAQSEIKHWHYRQCIEIYMRLLADYETDNHGKAMITSSIGGAYNAIGQKDSAMLYLAKAAIHDIQSATKETTALYRLAEMLCDKDPDRAYTYIYAAMEDADFYNARHRKLSINPILPIIEQRQRDVITRQRNMMGIIVAMCVLSLMIVAFAVIMYRKQNARLKRKSRQLMEANRIKEEYIGHSFYMNSEFITEVEELYKTINQKIAARQTEDLREMSKLAKVNKKRESMYESFDKCFLNIFPTFVREYAKLFPEGYVDPSSTTLTSEMRIFALIRLGITDSERISRFLNYSVHTIYTYKTRAKTKSIVSNEEFERRIKAVEMGTEV